MKKIILDLNEVYTKEELHEYLSESFGFPEYYGGNLDALYDCLTEISSPTAVGFFMPDRERKISDYLRRTARVMLDAESENPNLAVIFGELEDNQLSEE